MRGVDSLLTFNKTLKSEVEVERLLDMIMEKNKLGQKDHREAGLALRKEARKLKRKEALTI